MQIDDLRKLLDMIQMQIRAFDTKAQILLGANGVTATLIGTQLARAATFERGAPWFHVYVALTGLAGLGLCISFLFALWTIRPHISASVKPSVLFFGDLVRDYGNDYVLAARELIAYDDSKLLDDTASIVQISAVVCNNKSRRLRHAYTATGIALFAYLFSLWPAFIAASHVKPSNAIPCVLRADSANGPITCLVNPESLPKAPAQGAPVPTPAPRHP